MGAAWLIGVIVCFLLFATLLDPIDTIYNANVYSDIITIKTTDETSSKLTLDNADLIDANTGLFIAEHYSGELKVNSDIKVQFEKVTDNILKITLTAEHDTTAGAVYSPNNEAISFHTKGVTEVFIDSLKERVASGNIPYFALNGNLRVGEDYSGMNATMKPRLVRSGEISMVGQSRYMRGTFSAKALSVHTGEILNFAEGKCFGFVTIGQDNNLLASYRTMSSTAQIFKTGPKDSITTYNIGATKFERIIGADMFQSLSIFITILLAVLQIFDILRPVISQHKQ